MIITNPAVHAPEAIGHKRQMTSCIHVPLLDAADIIVTTMFETKRTGWPDHPYFTFATQQLVVRDFA